MTDIDALFNIIPGDLLARALVKLALQRASVRRCFHLCGDAAISSAELYAALRDLEPTIAMQAYPVWRNTVLNSLSTHDAGFLDIIKTLDSYLTRGTLKARFRSERTNAALEKAGVKLEIDKSKYLSETVRAVRAAADLNREPPTFEQHITVG